MQKKSQNSEVQKFGFISIASIFIILLVFSCSTEKNAPLNVGYHNMTARYNGYYNAGVIIDEAMLNYRTSVQEDFTKILPFDIYPNEKDVSAMYPELDDAIERCSKVIVRHSMPNAEVVKNKSKEYCRWIDDNWLVIGQAYYIKREYEEAKQKLKYVSESNFFRSEEAIYEAKIWLAKTYIALGEYSDATRVMITVKQAMDATESKKENKEKKKKPTKLEKKRAKRAGKKKDKGPADFPKKLIVEYELTMAELYLAQEEPKKAIKSLEKAVEACKNRKRRARYMFVLGQLYAKQGNDSKASYYFGKVAHSNAPYEMQFKAKIKNAITATGNTEDIEKQLYKMLKDGKNMEYKDQIYYALAEINMKKGDVKAAKSDYSNSVLWSIKNNYQKGTSYLRLADIHFDERDYLKAQRYYDSCVQVLPEDYENYEYLKSKALGLSDLVINYETVEFEDSVQRIGQMSPKEREKFLEKTLKEIEAEEKRKKIEAERRLKAQQERINKQQGGNGNGGGKKWYFSSAKTVGQGFNDFRGLWGQRVIEDDWRRSNKSSFSESFSFNGEEVDSVRDEGLSVDDLMKDIPLTQSAVDSSNNKILNSLYALGIIYKEQLKEEKEAISYFNAVIERKIEHVKVLPSLYQLYLIYNNKGNSKSKQYKTAIIKNYPKSEIAQILLDPDYLKKKELKDREELTEYSGVLRNYRRRSYGIVITKCNEIISNEQENQFINKYYLLKAFAVSKINAGNVEAISDPLIKLVEKSPKSEEGKQAKVYLGKLKKGEGIVDQDEKADTPYVFDEKVKHYAFLYIDNEEDNVSEIKIKMSNFNKEFFRSQQLQITDSPSGEKGQIIVVRSFKNVEKGKLYLTSFQAETAKQLLGTLATDYKIGLISTKNFGELFKQKEFDSYFKFYQANY